MGTRPKILDTFGDRPVHRPLKKLSGLEVVDAKLSAAQDKLSEHFNPTPPSSPKMTGKQLTLGWLPTQAPPSPKPKAIKAVPLKYHTQQMWAAALLVLAVLALGYTRGLNRASEYGGTYGGTDVPHSTLLVTEDGHATLLATTLLLVAILLAPVVLTRIGSRVALVLTAAMPTAFVWLLPVAAKFEFANSVAMLETLTLTLALTLSPTLTETPTLAPTLTFTLSLTRQCSTPTTRPTSLGSSPRPKPWGGWSRSSRCRWSRSCASRTSAAAGHSTLPGCARRA